MKNLRTDKPELLAPAGDSESFHAAIDAGANAIYLGLNDFNARLRAKNFSIKTLSYLLPYAHDRNVKVYVTLNTLVKQAELEPLIHTLYQLEQLGVDAIIAADLGLIHIAQKHFPELKLHASTQMTIHNSTGLRFAEKLGLRRVILSRELTLEEVAQLSKTTPVELELFVHGALCYGISGLCLASSFLGGSSGNRGRCTQVCRRKFKSAATSGYFFSPRDLCAMPFLPGILASGSVRSLKIEGRMKSAEYVYAVVKAYRLALDEPEKLHEAEALAAHDFGRPKTSFFLGGRRNPGIIDAREQSGIGELVGTIVERSENTLVVAPGRELFAHDRLRIQPQNGFDGEIAAVRHASFCADRSVITLKKPAVCAKGDTVYLIGRQGARPASASSAAADNVTPIAYRTSYPAAASVVDSFQASREPKAPLPRETLWIKIDDCSWLDHLYATPCQRLVLAGGREEMSLLLTDAVRLKSWRSRLVPSLPPFIPEEELQSWRELIGRFKTAGVTTWMCSNGGHLALFDKGYTLIADAPLACLNRAAQNAVLAMGFTFFTYSYEDDYLNSKPCGSPQGIAYLYAAVPLFISRVHMAIKPGVPFSDPHGNRFFTAVANSLHYTLAQKPLCLTHRRKKLSELGIKNFTLDLSFRKPDQEFLRSLIDCYKEGTRLPESSVFNFKAGLK